MKKYLFILLSSIALNSFSLTEGELEVIQDINSNVSDIQFQLSNFFSSDPENGYDLSLRDLFYWALYETDLPSIPRMLLDIVDQNVFYLPYLENIDYYLNNVLPTNLEFIPSIFYHLSDNWQDIVNGFLRNHNDLIDVRDSIHDLEMKQEGYLQGFSSGIEHMSDSLTQIVDLLQNQGGGSSGDLPIDTVGFYELGEYGKDVNIDGLSFHSVTTTGEYNKDVLRLLLNLNNVCGSQMNAALSILTNVQEIASSVTGSSEGEEKAEKDVEERQYKAESAINEADSINSMNWESYFTPPKIISDVYSSLNIYLEDTSLPEFITVIDTFHFDSESFSCEISNIGFSLTTHMIDLAYYARMVFGFIYWTLAFGLALFIFYWWLKLYFFVSKALFEK